MLNNLPNTVHPMAQLSAAVNLLSTESLFSKAYSDGVKKTEYWQVSYTLTIPLLLFVFISGLQDL